MRKPLALSSLVFGFLAVACSVGCGTSSSNQDGASPTTVGGGSEATGDGPGGKDSVGGGATPGPGGSSGGGNGTVTAGTLTAGAWDDNLNWDYYQSYLTKVGDGSEGYPHIARADRLRVSIVDAEGKPLPGAHVTVKHAGTVVLDAPTGADGGAFLFPTWVGVSAGETLDIVATSASGSGLAVAKAGDATVTVKIEGAHAIVPTTLDIALVLDTTGSMGDELAYLKAELDAISATLGKQHPGVVQRWALIVYRDAEAHDDYATRDFDFTTDLAAFRKNLSDQSFGGGGDYPESPEIALQEAAAKLTWSTGNAARLAFWVADAPHHADKVDAFVTALTALRTVGVHVYPIEASGADDLVEYSMRTAAQLTGGRYLFLTDDSGVGDTHAEPKLPCYFVTKLDDAIVRMVAMELSGTYLSPAASEILRVGGPLKDGQCALDSGQTVQAY